MSTYNLTKIENAATDLNELAHALRHPEKWSDQFLQQLEVRAVKITEIIEKNQCLQ